MSDDYYVNPSALEHDGSTFDTWSIELDGYQAGIPTTLVSSDFSLIPEAQNVWAQWVKAKASLSEYIGEGSDMMDGFARTLLETLRIYMEAEDFAQADIDRVTKELEDL